MTLKWLRKEIINATSECERSTARLFGDQCLKVKQTLRDKGIVAGLVAIQLLALY